MSQEQLDKVIEVAKSLKKSELVAMVVSMSRILKANSENANRHIKGLKK